MLLLANIAHAKLLYGDLEGTKTDMDTAAKTLDQLEGVENAVNAAYYRVAADYYKVGSSINATRTRTLTRSHALAGKGRLCALLQALAALSRLRRRCDRPHCRSATLARTRPRHFGVSGRHHLQLWRTGASDSLFQNTRCSSCLRVGFFQLMHPILDALDNTQHDWIKKLLFTFNEGNIGKFEALAPLFPQEVRCVACVRAACVGVCCSGEPR